MEVAMILWKEFQDWGLYEDIRPESAANLLHSLFTACYKHDKYWPTVRAVGSLWLGFDGGRGGRGGRGGHANELQRLVEEAEPRKQKTFLSVLNIGQCRGSGRKVSCSLFVEQGMS